MFGLFTLAWRIIYFTPDSWSPTFLRDAVRQFSLDGPLVMQSRKKDQAFWHDVIGNDWEKGRALKEIRQG